MTRRLRLLLVLLLLLSIPASAHPGGLDENGGHYNRTTGEYHYHHGYPAHKHTGGVCPYGFDDRTGYNSGSNSQSHSGSTQPRPTSPVQKSPSSENTVVLVILSGALLFFFRRPIFSFFSSLRSLPKKKPKSIPTPQAVPRPSDPKPPPPPTEKDGSPAHPRVYLKDPTNFKEDVKLIEAQAKKERWSNERLQEELKKAREKASAELKAYFGPAAAQSPPSPTPKHPHP